jgi:hypothetical protein
MESNIPWVSSCVQLPHASLTIVDSLQKPAVARNAMFGASSANAPMLQATMGAQSFISNAGFGFGGSDSGVAPPLPPVASVQRSRYQVTHLRSGISSATA